MKTIKFRALDSDLGRWFYFGDNADTKQIPYHLKAYTNWCQFTGLHDKNGKEIYEGDMFSLGDAKIKYVVEHHDCGLMGMQIGSSSWVGLTHWRDRIEVIGNIYENPELVAPQQVNR